MAIQTSYTVAPAAAFKGMLADDTNNDIRTMKNAESSLAMPFGNVVCFKTSSPGSDRDAVLPSSGEQKMAGIVVHSHDYQRTYTLADGSTAGELNSVGLIPGTELAILVKGCIWVQPETAVVPGDRLYVRADADTGENAFEYLGNVDNGTDESDMIDATAIGVFESSCAALGLAKLRVDFSQEA